MKEITRDETRGSYLLWYGVLAGPIVWSMQSLAPRAQAVSVDGL